MSAITEASETNATQTPKHIKGLVLAMASIYCQSCIAWAPSLAYDAHACRPSAQLTTAGLWLSSHQPTRKQGNRHTLLNGGAWRSSRSAKWLAAPRSKRNHGWLRVVESEIITPPGNKIFAHDLLCLLLFARGPHVILSHLHSPKCSCMRPPILGHPGPQPCAGMFVYCLPACPSRLAHAN